MGAMLLKVSVCLFVLMIQRIAVGFECSSLRPIKCPAEKKCIFSNWVCGGGKDCSDRSDETYCNDRPMSCSKSDFQCSSGACKGKLIMCNGVNDCGDNSDEFYCEYPEFPLPPELYAKVKIPINWMRCSTSNRLIPLNWKCDEQVDCPDGSDENNCTRSPIVNSTHEEKVSNARSKGIAWLLSRRKPDSSTDRWGPELHRIATALYLADEHFFTPGNKAGEEIGYELTIQLLHKLSRNITLKSQELALYIQALTATCSDPKDFYGHNLVMELRRRVEAANYTNPFEILALCNAKDNMTSRDIVRVSTAYDSQYRPFWTDTQAIATMALQCLSSCPNVRVDERTVKEMQDELKKRQFGNGTVDNTFTTALVVQALQSKDGYKMYFNLTAAIAALVDNQKTDGSWGSIRNSYYILPAICNKSFLNISSTHCVKHKESAEEVLQKLQDAEGDKFVVQYSVWIGNAVDLGRTWRVRMKTSRDNSFYDVIETVRKLDSNHNVTYHVIENKPYVSSLYGKEDDPELGVYWFTYVRSLQSSEAPKLIESSPVDVKVLPKQELILWYKHGRWSTNESYKQEEL